MNRASFVEWCDGKIEKDDVRTGQGVIVKYEQYLVVNENGWEQVMGAAEFAAMYTMVNA